MLAQWAERWRLGSGFAPNAALPAPGEVPDAGDQKGLAPCGDIRVVQGWGGVSGVMRTFTMPRIVKTKVPI